MPLLSEDEHLADLRAQIELALTNMQNALRQYCPGPHFFKQHRDKQPAWCNTCGRDGRGVMRKKVKNASSE